MLTAAEHLRAAVEKREEGRPKGRLHRHPPRQPQHVLEHRRRRQARLAAGGDDLRPTGRPLAVKPQGRQSAGQPVSVIA